MKYKFDPDRFKEWAQNNGYKMRIMQSLGIIQVGLVCDSTTEYLGIGETIQAAIADCAFKSGSSAITIL